MIENLTTAKKYISDAIQELEHLKYENNRIKGILYRSIMANGNKLSKAPLTDDDIVSSGFRVTKDTDGNFVVIIEKQKTLKNEN